jgi:hypothetical protein
VCRGHKKGFGNSRGLQPHPGANLRRRHQRRFRPETADMFLVSSQMDRN